MTDGISFATLDDLSTRLRDKEISPVELCEHYLDRIERYNPQLNAYIAVTAERALAAAKAAEASLIGGQRLGPLHGIPMAIKDLVDVAGLPTTGGTTMFVDCIATEDATIVKRLANAGVVMLGKTHLVEFAFGGVGINHHYGTPWNPWDADTHRIPGGSSSGSAVAVAAGLATAAIGSDTGGSVRIPASFCGLVGLKPTYGRVSRQGLLPLDSSLDSAGPMARTVMDTALIYQAIAGPDPADHQTLNLPYEAVMEGLQGDIQGTRLCLPKEYFWDRADPEVEAAVRTAADAFAGLGARVEERSFSELDDLIALRARGSLVAVETCLNWREQLEHQLDQFDPIVAARMLDGKKISAVDYLDIQRQYDRLRQRVDRALLSIDALIAPTTPLLPPPVEQVDNEDVYFEINGLCLRNTMAANLLGLCAISLPCGLSSGGLPIGLQLIGRAFDEAKLLRLAHAFEQATDWSGKHPEMGGFD